MTISKSMNALMNYGGIIGVALVCAALLVYILGLDYDSSVSNILTYGVMIGGLFFFLKKYRDEQNGGYISFSAALGAGSLMMLFAGIIGTFYNWLSISFIYPGIIDKVKEKSYEQYISMGMSEEAAIEALEQASPYLTAGWMAFFSFFGYVIMGVIFSLVISFFIKRENPNPLNEA